MKCALNSLQTIVHNPAHADILFPLSHFTTDCETISGMSQSLYAYMPQHLEYILFQVKNGGIYRSLSYFRVEICVAEAMNHIEEIIQELRIRISEGNNV